MERWLLPVGAYREAREDVGSGGRSQSLLSGANALPGTRVRAGSAAGSTVLAAWRTP